jgi:hypothetical protein
MTASKAPPMTSSPTPETVAAGLSEAGWLVEEDCGGFVHWIALTPDQWPRYADLPVWRGRKADLGEYRTPVRRVKDANEALRFARKDDADEFIRLFGRFLLHAKATEHCWPITQGSPQ